MLVCALLYITLHCLFHKASHGLGLLLMSGSSDGIYVSPQTIMSVCLARAQVTASGPKTKVQKPTTKAWGARERERVPETALMVPETAFMRDRETLIEMENWRARACFSERDSDT